MAKKPIPYTVRHDRGKELPFVPVVNGKADVAGACKTEREALETARILWEGKACDRFLTRKLTQALPAILREATKRFPATGRDGEALEASLEHAVSVVLKQRREAA